MESFSELPSDALPTSTPITAAWTVTTSSPGGPAEEREPSRLFPAFLELKYLTDETGDD